MNLVDFSEDGGQFRNPPVTLEPQLHDLRRDLTNLPGDPFGTPDPAPEIDVPTYANRKWEFQKTPSKKKYS